jgi:phosphopantothenoylcysteine decarboxylase / phosphopantothenate---cysteine ligase
MENGRAKLLRKGADAIVVNDATGENVGIDSETNAATFLTSTTAIELPLMPKRQLADRILDEILTLRRPRPVVLELDGREDSPSRAEQAEREHRMEEETIVAASARRQLIVE